MTVSMKALRSFVYAGQRLQSGQEFQARTGRDAKLLAAIGHAQAFTAPPPTGVPYMTRDVAEAPQTRGVDIASMDREELHALAAERGVKVHHMAGAAKVRQALLDAERA
jgi:hypothetical protein